MITLAEEIEINDLTSDMIIPVFVDMSGDWPGAVLAAAKLERAEVIIRVDRTSVGTCVFSDDDYEHSSPWWRAQIGHWRSYIGR